MTVGEEAEGQAKALQVPASTRFRLSLLLDVYWITTFDRTLDDRAKKNLDT